MDAHMIAGRQAYEASATGPVVWGVSDCATSAAAAIHAMTGVDHWAFYRGRYHDRESLRALVGCGVSRLVKRFAKGCGWTRSDGRAGLCIGVVIGQDGPAVAMGFDGVWMARGGLGVVVEDIKHVHSAWRVA